VGVLGREEIVDIGCKAEILRKETVLLNRNIRRLECTATPL
jgi:hypothetical protein